ncbi:MAG: phosphomannose isomerase type II C-terminal cupin domain [Nanoarchaeota archaeon]
MTKTPQFYNEKRPWGSYTLFADNEKCSVKILGVAGQLSLQSHNYREEKWYVISGRVEVRLGKVLENWKETKKSLETVVLEAGESVMIPIQYVHTLKCLSDVPAQILEISSGEYREDDIIRYEDVYGRV